MIGFSKIMAYFFEENIIYDSTIFNFENNSKSSNIVFLFIKIFLFKKFFQRFQSLKTLLLKLETVDLLRIFFLKK